MEQVCDEIALLHEGRIAVKGSLEEMRKRKKEAAMELEMERVEETKSLLSAFPFLKNAQGSTLVLEDAKRLPDILHFIADRKMAVVRMERQETALVDLFMEVVGK